MTECIHSTRLSLLLALFLILIGTCAVPPAAADDSRLEQGVAAYEAEDYERAYELLKPEAEDGDADARFFVGRMYSFGRGVEQDFERGIRTSYQAAQQGQPQAQRTIGYSYLKGVGVREDHEEAVRWYRKAAEAGDPPAQRSMGLRYKNGEGVERDYEEAAEWFRRAAQQGDARAAYELGKMYREGKGTERDHAEAVRWFGQAAENDNAGAKARLAWHYEMGRGVETDYDRAETLYKQAIRAGRDGPLDYYRLGSTLKKRGDETDSAEDYAEALKYLEKAARGGVEVAMLDTALGYLNGYGGERNRVDGYAWLRVLDEKAEQIRVQGLEDQIRTVRARMMPEQRDEGRERFEELLTELE